MSIANVAAARMWATEEEMLGWMYVTNQLLLNNICSTVCNVEEPSNRVEIEMEYVTGLTSIFYTHASSLTSSLFRVTENAKGALAETYAEKKKVEAEIRTMKENSAIELQLMVKEKDALKREIEVLAIEEQKVHEAAHDESEVRRNEAVREKLNLELDLQELRQEVEKQRKNQKNELEDAQLELKKIQENCAVQKKRLQDAHQRFKILADVIAHPRMENLFEPIESGLNPVESLFNLLDRYVDFARDTQQTIRDLQEECTKLRDKLETHESVVTPRRHEVPTLYQRIVPPPPINSVALTLLNVREQVRELRPTSVVTPYGIVNTPRTWNTHQQHQSKEYISMNANYISEDAMTPQSSPPVLRYQTPLVKVPENVSSAALAWKERMTLLQAEVRDLRREIER